MSNTGEIQLQGDDAYRSAFVDALKDIAFGSVAGMVSKVFEHPFDLCKVRLQSQVLDANARFKGPVDCLYQTWKHEGIRGLYRGLPAPVVGAMAENATLFMSYGQLQRATRLVTGKESLEDLTIAQRALAAGGAGCITSFVLTPIELVKCKMQVQMLAVTSHSSSAASIEFQNVQGAGVGALHGPASLSSTSHSPNFKALPGPFAVLSSIIRTNGVRGLWLGQTGTLLRETGGCAAWFSSKEAVSNYLLSLRSSERTDSSSTLSPPLTAKDLKMWESALSGAVAGVAYNVVLFPADSVKSAIQTEEELRPRGAASGGGRPTGFLEMATKMYGKSGVRGLYAGMGITIARSVPSSALIFLLYDGLSKRFG